MIERIRAAIAALEATLDPVSRVVTDVKRDRRAYRANPTYARGEKSEEDYLEGIRSTAHGRLRDAEKTGVRAAEAAAADLRALEESTRPTGEELSRREAAWSRIGPLLDPGPDRRRWPIDRVVAQLIGLRDGDGIAVLRERIPTVIGSIAGPDAVDSPQTQESIRRAIAELDSRAESAGLVEASVVEARREARHLAHLLDRQEASLRLARAEVDERPGTEVAQRRIEAGLVESQGQTRQEQREAQLQRTIARSGP